MIEVPTKVHADTPEGSPFIIDSCPFNPGSTIDVSLLDIAEDKVYDWPMVYILANDTKAYVGQTTSVINRMGQHGKNSEKSAFTQANLIYNDEFNASVITDYEHRLIGLMHADGRYKLTNKNEGMTNSNYFAKEQYAEMFDSLWEDLRRLELADHTISEIEESEVFKYSPYKGLNTDQRVALDKILEAIHKGFDNAQPIVVEGMPGTGKTILAIYLLKMLKDNPAFKDLNIKIMEPVTSLRDTLKNTLKNVEGLSPNDVISPSDLTKPKSGFISPDEKGFDIVLIDEAHRLKCRTNLGLQFGSYDKVNKKLNLPKEATQVDWILDQVKFPIFFYDPYQSVGPHCISYEKIHERLHSAFEHAINLENQMRVRGGKQYLEYIKAILEGENPEYQTFSSYKAVLHQDVHDFIDSFEKDLAAHSLTRMIAGYAWKWESKKDTNIYDIVIDDIKLKWNSTQNNWVGIGLTNEAVAHEVGCIHTTQGYDLSNAYIIIGNDIALCEETGKLEANKSNYFDRAGSSTATQDELTRYIKNIYYVLLSRGIDSTHIYVCDPVLRKHFSRYF